MRSLCLLMLLGALAVGCGQATTAAAPAAADPEAATAAVTAYFAAAEARDCTRLIPLQRVRMTGEACADYVDHFGPGRTVLVGLGDARVDGRDHQRIIVTAKVTFGGTPHSWLVRVECDPTCKVDLQ